MATKKQWGTLKIGCFGVLTIVAMLVVWLGYMVVWAFTAKPGTGIAGAVRIEELIAIHQPKGHDGAAAFQSLVETAALFTLEEQAFRKEFPEGSKPADWPRTIDFPYDFAAMEQLGVPAPAVANTTALMDRLAKSGVPDALDRIAAEPAFARPIVAAVGNQVLIDLLLPELGKVRAFARYNGARIARATSDGNEPEIVRAFDSSLGVARAAAADPIVISRLLALAVFTKASGDLRAALTERRLSAATLTALLESLDRQTVWPPFDMCLEGERAFALDMIQRSFSDDGDGDGRMIQTEVDKFRGVNPTAIAAWLGASKLMNVVGFAVPGKKENVTRANELYDAMIAHARKPIAVRRALGSISASFDEADQRRYPALATIIPALDRAVQADSTLAPLIDGTRLMLVIELYRAKNDGYPASLDALAPEFIPAVPTDAFTGTPFGYRRLDTPDEFGRSYILYSYGANAVDDKGAYDPKANFLSDSEAARASPFDVIFNTPRTTFTPPD